MIFVKKKLISIILCAALVFAMAIPAFADGTISNEDTGGLLNCYGDYSSNFSNRNVTDYKTTTAGKDQLWYLDYTNYQTLQGYVVSSVSDVYGTKYGLNINTSTKNCNIYRINGNEHDALCVYGPNYIKLANYALYLNSTGLNQNVNWSGSGNIRWYYSH